MLSVINIINYATSLMIFKHGGRRGRRGGGEREEGREERREEA